MEQEAKIFLSEERGVTQSEWMRSYNTFNFGNYKARYKTPVDKLYVLNDDTLAAEKSMRMNIEEDTLFMLLPVAGAVEYKDSKGNEHNVTTGKMLVNGLSSNDHYGITNPYPNALINFLQIWIKQEKSSISLRPGEKAIDINNHKNEFVKQQLTADTTIHIGKFSGRNKAIIDLANKKSTCFAFVIEGAFELEERLLHARDGLALWNTTSIDMEALSNDAIMLVIEMKK